MAYEGEVIFVYEKEAYQPERRFLFAVGPKCRKEIVAKRIAGWRL